MTYTRNDITKRYRAKLKLIQEMKDIFAKWQTLKSPQSTRTPQEVKRSLDAIVKLPKHWQEKDLATARRNLMQFKNDLYFNNIANLQVNVDQGRSYAGHNERFKKQGQATADAERARAAMEIVYDIMVNALFLANKEENDHAAVAVEVCRHVARMLVNQNPIPESDATALCLAMLPPTFVKPPWVTVRLAKILKKNFFRTDELIQALFSD